MMKGRKPRPTILKIIEGNPGRRRIPVNEPIPAHELPAPPDDLNDDAKLEWSLCAGELYRIGLLSRIDRTAFAAYCESVGLWMICNRGIAKLAAEQPDTMGGMMVMTTHGVPTRNPLVQIAMKARADAVRYAAEFGMTPSARARLGSETPRAPNKFAGLLGREQDEGETA